MRQILRVKNATPSGIVPAGNSNANLHSSHSGSARTLRVLLGSIPIFLVQFRFWQKGPRRTADGRTIRALPFSHQIQRHFQSDIDFVQQTTPMEFAQTCFLALTEIKEKMFAIIFSAELR